MNSWIREKISEYLSIARFLQKIEIPALFPVENETEESMGIRIPVNLVHIQVTQISFFR